MKWKLSLLTLGVVLLAAACSTKPAPTPSAPAPATNAPVSTEAPSESPPASDPIACTPAQGKMVTIATAKLYVEYNSTNEDLGVHGAFDDHGYSELCVYDPNGTQVLAVKPQAQLKDLTMASIFFESREPPTSEFSFADLKANFPEGQYEVRAISFDGTGLTGAATFSHNVPAPPTVTYPAIVDEENAGDVVVSTTGLVIEWEDVTETVEGGPVTITGYEVIITKIEHNDPQGYSRPIFDVHVPPNQNSLAVPVEFLEPDTVYELEILALEESGNQTITVGFFTTASPVSSESANPFAAVLPTIEYNATDGDLGFHVELDGSPWKQVSVDPNFESRRLPK